MKCPFHKTIVGSAAVSNWNAIQIILELQSGNAPMNPSSIETIIG